MAKRRWSEITREDVIKAIGVFEVENPEYPAARSTFLLYEGKKYPAKHIRGMAYKVHFNEEVLKDEYTGGGETVRFFEKLGFEMQYVHKSVDTHPKKSIKKESKIKNAPPQNAKSLTKKKAEESNVEPEGIKAEKIKIPVKGVTEQKNALQLILNKICDGDIVCEKTYPWMKTPMKIENEYQKIYDALVSYRGNTDFYKKNVKLRCDFVCESKKIIIEYDERQHFSEARRISLKAYPGIKLFYDQALWENACLDIQAKDNQPVNRDETRAFYDCVRDIEAVKNGYRLVRIMHGQVDFNEEGAAEKLKEILEINTSDINDFVPKENISEVVEQERTPLKIGLYLQTDDVLYSTVFRKTMARVKKSDIDILVFPEFSYATGMMSQLRCADYLKGNSLDLLVKKVLELSEDIGKAVVLGSEDGVGRIISIFANAKASEGETKYKVYFKHTMAEVSAFDFDDYPERVEELFKPIIFKGYRIGLTICYDCNHSMFSRKYYQNGVDIILNGTGGNVVYNKWHKYNKVRAIENECFTFVTMGGPWGDNMHNYVYGFTPTGKEMTPVLLNGDYTYKRNLSGAIYVYDTSEYDGTKEKDNSVEQRESPNTKSDFSVKLAEIDSLMKKGKAIAPHIRVLAHGKDNVVLCFVEENDIMKPEKILKLLYSKELQKYKNKKYIIVNSWDNVDREFYESQLSVILKVRAMENYCAVILTSGNLIKCFQTGMNRTAQVVQAVDGQFGIDLSRTGGPDTIWKNKKNWRKNVECLIETMVDID